MTSAALVLGAAMATLSSLDQLEPTIRAEARSGTAPPASVMPGAFFLAMVTPNLAFVSTNPGERLQAIISTRLLLREPNPADSHRLLARHSLELNHRKQHSPRWAGQLGLQGSYGEEDYTTLRDTLAATTGGSLSGTAQTTQGGPPSGTSQPVTATPPVALSMMNVRASLGVEFRSSRIAETNLQLDTYYRERLNGDDTAPNNYQTLPKQWVSTANLSHSKTISRTRRINTSLREAYARVASQPDTFTTQSTVGITETITRFNSIAFDIGASYVKRISSIPEHQSPGLSPIANLRWSGILSNERNTQIHANAMLGYVWGFDPISGVGSTRIPMNLSFDFLLENRVNISANITYITLVSQTTTSSNSLGVSNGTMFSAALPVTYRWSEQFTIESGVRMGLRGPRMAGPSELSELELWGYIAITATTRHRLN